MFFKSMIDLLNELWDGSVIRYKNFVLVTRFDGKLFEVSVWEPIETEEETGVEFERLRLENATEWDGEKFETEGEALKGGIEWIDFVMEGNGNE